MGPFVITNAFFWGILQGESRMKYVTYSMIGDKNSVSLGRNIGDSGLVCQG